MKQRTTEPSCFENTFQPSRSIEPQAELDAAAAAAAGSAQIALRPARSVGKKLHRFESVVLQRSHEQAADLASAAAATDQTISDIEALMSSLHQSAPAAPLRVRVTLPSKTTALICPAGHLSQAGSESPTAAVPGTPRRMQCKSRYMEV